MLRCPICEQYFDPAQSTAMPFCCERCRRIDLGRWLRESYRVPVERADDPDGEFGEDYPPE
ncbi:MAG: DNA gyrase inhibitor YacG [Pirellulaceae bacterium]